MPPGGDGFYYFSFYLLLSSDEYGNFDIQLNGERMCTVYGDQVDTPDNEGPMSCSAVSYATAGKKLNSIISPYNTNKVICLQAGCCG